MKPLCVYALCLHAKLLTNPNEFTVITDTLCKQNLYKAPVYMHIICNPIQSYVHAWNKYNVDQVSAKPHLLLLLNAQRGEDL